MARTAMNSWGEQVPQAWFADDLPKECIPCFSMIGVRNWQAKSPKLLRGTPFPPGRGPFPTWKAWKTALQRHRRDLFFSQQSAKSTGDTPMEAPPKAASERLG
jgi:hypothetical protein